jgi:hypothetical protein
MTLRLRYALVSLVVASETAVLAISITSFDAVKPDDSIFGLTRAHAGIPLHEMLTTLAWWMLAGIAGWFLITGLMYAGATIAGLTGAAARIGRFTPRVIRLLVDRAAVVSLTIAMLGTGAPATAADDLKPGTGPAAPDTPRTAEIPHPGLQRLTSDAAPEPAASTPSPSGNPTGEHLVVPGDNLWRIAAGHITANAKTPIGVRTYWLMVIEANRNRLRSGDPNLIFPGESIVLPEIPEAS